MPGSDLALAYFKKLRAGFFDEKLAPKPFYLKLKKNTQDDPFDELLTSDDFIVENALTQKSPGPLITPDFVLYTSPLPKTGVCLDQGIIIAVENKRIELRANEPPRLSSIDFNSTPPCGTIRVYKDDLPFDIRSFYLISILKDNPPAPYEKALQALCLVDGDFINQDFNMYLESVGPREKKINVGSYEDGIDRVRPMFVFPNPISIDDLDHSASLIHKSADLGIANPDIMITHEIVRASVSGSQTFYVYRMKIDCDNIKNCIKVGNPFLDKKSKKETSARGKFKL